jgi:hypothetical protein
LLHALGRETPQLGRTCDDRAPRSGVDRKPQSAGKANRPQRTEPILTHPRLGVADRANDTALEVRAAAVRVAHRVATRVVGNGVDREVAARQIVVQGRAELHNCVSSVGAHVPPEGRDLVQPAEAV